MFEQRRGVRRHLLRMRLELVHTDLGDPVLAGVQIAQIAERGRTSQRDLFQRAFGRLFDCAPGDVRAAVRLGAPLRPCRDTRERRPDSRFVDVPWIITLDKEGPTASEVAACSAIDPGCKFQPTDVMHLGEYLV